MKASNFSLESYLRRISVETVPTADSAGIAAMMRAHLFAVPFENLDVRAGRGVSLVPEDIVVKIIDRQRGGYCYEVNGLFAIDPPPLKWSALKYGFEPMRGRTDAEEDPQA